MRRTIKRLTHIIVFTYIFWWTMTRDFEYIYSYYFS